MGNKKSFSNLITKKYHFTYQTKCLTNGKLYVGRHSTDDLNDGYIGSGKLLKRAVKKYGKENFTMIALCFFDSYEELIKEEEFLIDKEWCNDSTNYNLVQGGTNPIMYGEMNPAWKGGVSKEPMYRRSGKVHDFSGKNNPRYGYSFSIEEKRKMVTTQKKRQKVKVGSIIYESKRQCAKSTGMSRDGVTHRLKSNNFPEWNLV